MVTIALAVTVTVVQIISVALLVTATEAIHSILVLATPLATTIVITAVTA